MSSSRGNGEAPLADFRAADLLYRQGKHGEALALLDELDKRFPYTRNLMYARALCLAALDRRVEAIDVCDTIIGRFDAPRAVALKASLTDEAEDLRAAPARGAVTGRRILIGIAALALMLAVVALVPWPNREERRGNAVRSTPSTSAPRSPSVSPKPVTAPPDPAKPQLDMALTQYRASRWTRAMVAAAQILQARPDHPGASQLVQWVRDARRIFAQEHGDPNGDTRVTCLDNPGQSYELYIPSTALPEQSAVLYLFSSSGDGKDMLRRFAPAAERLGWIAAASNNSRNGPWAPIFEAQDAVLRDTEERLDLHPRRRFASGFSGGARASLALAFRHPDRICGVLAMGAGWPINTTLAATDRSLSVCILIGDQDSNIQHDIPSTEEKLRAAGIQCVTSVYRGGHVPPPPEMIQAACDWLNARSGY